jgi:hypothetical protein
MGVSLKQASKILNMTRNEVMDLVTSGELKAERKRKGLIIEESDLGLFLSRTKPQIETGPSCKPRQVSLPHMLVGPLMEHISAMKTELSEKLDLLAENRQLAQELSQARLDIANRDAEIEKLKSDAFQQKRLAEKEIEDRMRILAEERMLLEKQVSERVSRERDAFDKTLQAERTLWSERLEHEQRHFQSELNQLKAKQGFWTRLMKMLTWS